ALELARAGSPVRLVHRSGSLTARDDIVEQIRKESQIDDLPGWELESLHGGDHLEEVVLRKADGQCLRVAAEGLVVKIARVPRTEVFRGQLDLTRAGAIVVDRELHTSRDGVFAAGDVVADAYARVAAALGQGSLAARSVLRYLQSQTPMKNELSVAEVVDMFERTLRSSETARTARHGVLRSLLELHENNIDQWKWEDLPRRDTEADHAVAAAKRAIDVLNTKRHQLVEATDAALVASIDQDPSASPTTESPAMVFDRLSVLVIRIAFTER